MSIIQYKKLFFRYSAIPILLLAVVVFATGTVQAAGLKVAPLKYEEVMEVGEEKTGYVDVANPSDATVTVQASVEGFRQISSQGDLEFYRDERLSQGITIDVDEFELGPREAARIQFEIDTNALPEGGVYAAILFATEAFGSSEDLSSINTSVRVGTLLMLQNGEGEKSGSLESLNIPFWQFGDGIEGTVGYHNTEEERAIGYSPELLAKVSPWGGDAELETGLVLPGVTRQFGVVLEGGYLGILPVSVDDATTGSESTSWVFAVTGIWRVILPIFMTVLLASILLQRYFYKH